MHLNRSEGDDLQDLELGFVPIMPILSSTKIGILIGVAVLCAVTLAVVLPIVLSTATPRFVVEPCDDTDTEPPPLDPMRHLYASTFPQEAERGFCDPCFAIPGEVLPFTLARTAQ